MLKLINFGKHAKKDHTYVFNYRLRPKYERLTTTLLKESNTANHYPLKNPTRLAFVKTTSLQLTINLLLYIIFFKNTLASFTNLRLLFMLKLLN